MVAQSPHVLEARKILTAEIEVVYEELEPGPIGARVHVVDYDATTGTLYRPARLAEGDVAAPTNATIRGDPAFHAANVYGLVAHTLARFERALGRRVDWSFRAHQLKVVPHAFEEANAFYSREGEALLFGYYRSDAGLVHLCLSHDIVVHETTHALLDGLRWSFMKPSSADQAAFHEAFADMVALLSVFSLKDVLGLLLDREAERREAPPGLIHKSSVTLDRLKSSVLSGLADEMEAESGTARVSALRRSVEITPAVDLLDRDEFREPHRRGEILVAAVMRAFLDVWSQRIGKLGTIEGQYADRARVCEDGADVADLLLTILIRALDYTPPIHIDFSDYLTALLTADTELRGGYDRYSLRATLRSSFAEYGIGPPPTAEDGIWRRSDLHLGREGVRFASLQTDPTEVFLLIWANRSGLKLDPSAYTRVASVRPCIRVSPDDGFTLRETVAECTQYVKVPASELRRYGLVKPAGMDDAVEIELQGGSTLILDEFGTLKYEIYNRLPSRSNPEQIKGAQDRLVYLWKQGYIAEGASTAGRLSTLHRLRAGLGSESRQEGW